MPECDSLAGFPLLTMAERSGLKEAVEEEEIRTILTCLPDPQLEAIGEDDATTLVRDLVGVRISSSMYAYNSGYRGGGEEYWTARVVCKA